MNSQMNYVLSTSNKYSVFSDEMNDIFNKIKFKMVNESKNQNQNLNNKINNTEDQETQIDLEDF